MDDMTYDDLTPTVDLGLTEKNTEETPMDMELTWTIVWKEPVQVFELVENKNHELVQIEYVAGEECTMVFLDEDKAMSHLRFLWAHGLNAYMLHGEGELGLPGIIGKSRIWFTKDIVD